MAEYQLPEVLADTPLSGASPLPQWIAFQVESAIRVGRALSV
ncbi:hypothetical protein C4J97_4597 [Pseudomonas orientalis]|nr:hypothetical protein C4J97_4597 [Pseudomonas orientalis]